MTVAPHPGDLRDPRQPVVTVARDEPYGAHFPTHRHFRAQLVYASEGVMQVTTAGGTWVVPPQQAVWMPAGIDHDVYADGALSMRSLYVHPQAARGLGDECRVVLVEPLLRELILKVVELARQGETGESYARLAGVILDELRELKPAPLHLPLPRDARLRAITAALLDDPGDERDLAAWGRHVGASGRTLARLFRRETAMTFAGWRRRLRLLAAVSRLAAGQPVTTVAYDLGYRSPSAFVSMFRRILGTTPRRYLRRS
ncbi:MAG: helix-turn-helix transcriptional regulator [Gammaproteobacteria bacterium]|nr:helix-turn-helix transcriptional regulator [Gammaproteobacteria bacterium]